MKANERRTRRLQDGMVRHPSWSHRFGHRPAYRATSGTPAAPQSLPSPPRRLHRCNRSCRRRALLDRPTSIKHAYRVSTPFTTTATPNHALQPTATLAFSSRCPALTSTGSVTAGAPAMKPGTCRAFASRRLAHTPAPRSRWLSLGSLGVFTRRP